MKQTRTVRINLWGTPIGYLHQEDNGLVGFQYNKDFLSSGIELSPIKMPLSNLTYSFPTLSEETFHGLPGMVADSLPDKFGNMVMRRYLDSQGRTEDSLSVIEKLCYTGKRGMGALEYEPAQELGFINESVDLGALTKLASEILSEKEHFRIQKDDHLMAQLMESGSSVGGARAKTLIAWNQETNDIRSGQIHAGTGYTYWLLKFDNIQNNKDKDATADPGGYTRVEYAYYLMALASGITMSECKLYEENGSAHFMTKRFDRIGEKCEKLHMQSLCALAHMDFCMPRFYSYEEAFAIMRQLRLPYKDFLQLYTRMVFNDVARNYDDHTKNISFLMNKQGVWSLAPAYDVTFSYKKVSNWVRAHQMLINGKAEEITQEDLLQVASIAGIKKSDAIEQIERVWDAVGKWRDFAQQAGLPESRYESIQKMIAR